MSAPFNLSRYNLTGFNVTPANKIYIKVRINDKFDFVAVSTTNNVFPKARLYITITKGRLTLNPGRFAKASNNLTITKQDMLGIGCSWRHIEAVENIIGTFDFVREFWRKVTSTDTFEKGTVQLIGCSWRQTEVSEEINIEKAEINSYYWSHVDVIENITKSLTVSSKTLVTVRSNDALTGKFRPSEIVITSAIASDAITGSLILSADNFTSTETLDLIDTSCSVLSLEFLTCVLTVTLKPGQTMVIDANTYNVWIDGENAVYTHSGDWLDELDRNTQNFVITAASGGKNISASILYTERYL